MQTANGDYQPERNTPIRLQYRQCVWCGMRLDGPLAGYRATDVSGRPQKLMNYVHSICGACRDGVRDRFEQVRDR